ncbi:malignant fibrous histiocytoma-amplified sequence 1 homolog [Haliotis cracherodii]|uniref:malignant fibrous histiocytoma-amplified sequence 1 homolog n=1 Tax=Haliotis cracherodii TaxID=6455 RepID=UPI0039EB3C29
MNQSQVSESLRQYLTVSDGGRQVLYVPEGSYKGWIPRALYTFDLDELYLPFLKLLSFPVGHHALGTLKDMLVFQAIGNYLIKLPSSFAECTKLVHLNLGFNHFVEIPHAIYSLVNLEELDLAENDIQSMSEDIGNLGNLRVLNLSGNNLQNVPVQLYRCKKIQRLYMSGKFYPRGQLKIVPEGVYRLSELLELDMSWQSIETIPDGIGNLHKLRSFNLKGNSLIYVSKDIQYCRKLHTLNLTGALRYCSVVPSAIFMIEELQCLYLSGNYFTEIPSEVCGLKKLKTLHIQRNALLRLPEELFNLKNLEHIDLSENYIDNIPPGISKLHRLFYLGLERNKLTSIPKELCNCRSLQHLLLGSNQLTNIPEKICKLVNLTELTLDNNQLTEIPLLLDNLQGLLQSGVLYLYNNNLKKPPQAICDQGVVPLFHFLKELRISEAKHRRKMILIGAVKAGKTSLKHALVLGHSKLTLEHERTWVLERHLWEPESQLRVQILDFGGHHIYSAAHHMFLTPEALHVLVFDFTKYNMDLYDALIGDWLDAIMDRAPGATIMAAGTHADLCSDEDINDKTEDILRKMHRDENAKIEELTQEIEKMRKILEKPEVKDGGGGKFSDIGIERLQEKMYHMQKMLNTRSKLPSCIFAVSCAEDLLGMEGFKENLITRLKETEEKPLPESWHKFLLSIQNHPDRILPLEEALDKFMNIMSSLNQSMISLGGSPDLSLGMVLKYLHSTGEIVWYHENQKLKSIVFHRPETLIEMLRAVFRHDFEEIVVYVEEHGKAAGLSPNKFDILKQDFIRKGLMAYELLHYTLCHFQLSADALDTFVSLMLKFELCYEVPKSPSAPSLIGSSRILQFPWFFPAEVPDSLATRWPAVTPPNQFELRYTLSFPSKGPPYFFEKFSVRLQSHVSDRINWKFGILARKNLSRLLIRKERIFEQDVVTLAFRGTDLQELWQLVIQTRSDLLGLLQEWPFIRFELLLVCSHCILKNCDDPYLFPGEVLEFTVPKDTVWENWCRKHEDELMPACFVYPLDPDYQDDLPRHMQAATEFLQNCGDTVDGGGLLSDAGLGYIASRLGFEWTLIALQLGLSQAQIEQIQMKHPQRPYHQIHEALSTWRNRENVGSVEDRLAQLLTVLESEEIGRNDLAETLRERFHL